MKRMIAIALLALAGCVGPNHEVARSAPTHEYVLDDVGRRSSEYLKNEEYRQFYDNMDAFFAGRGLTEEGRRIVLPIYVPCVINGEHRATMNAIVADIKKRGGWSALDEKQREFGMQAVAFLLEKQHDECINEVHSILSRRIAASPKTSETTCFSDPEGLYTHCTTTE